MSMVLSSLKQLPSYELVSNQMHELKRLVALLLDDGSGGHQNANYIVRKRRAKQEEEWTLEHSQTSMKIVSQNKDIHQQQEQLQQISTNIQQLKTLTTQSLPTIISRIIHATSPIIHEISRGYFVPFLTVALGCLGRIHCLLLQFGRELVSVLSEVVPQLRVACSTHEMIHDWKVLESIVSPSFVIETTKKTCVVPSMLTKDSKNASTDTSTTTQEWNDLMTQYLEVSQDSITKQMSEFVKRKRLDSARLRFGVGNMKKNVSNDNQEGDNDDELSANDDEMQIPSESILNDTSDMGELVSMHKSDDSSITQTKSSEGVDPNMARIRQHRESTKIAPATDLSSAKKKKRRKKKRKEQPEVDGTDKDDPVSSKVFGEKMPHEHLDKATDTSVTALETTTHDDKPRDTKDMKTEKKSKKKNKKSKKRKKASSVIDDIFG